MTKRKIRCSFWIFLTHLEQQQPNICRRNRFHLSRIRITEIHDRLFPNVFFSAKFYLLNEICANVFFKKNYGIHQSIVSINFLFILVFSLRFLFEIQFLIFDGVAPSTRGVSPKWIEEFFYSSIHPKFGNMDFIFDNNISFFPVLLIFLASFTTNFYFSIQDFKNTNDFGIIYRFLDSNGVFVW